MRMLQRVIAACALVVAMLTGLAAGGVLPLTVVRLTSPAAPFSDATLEIQTIAGADSTITAT